MPPNNTSGNVDTERPSNYPDDLQYKGGNSILYNKIKMSNANGTLGKCNFFQFQ